jgi:hypothetical protein
LCGWGKADGIQTGAKGTCKGGILERAKILDGWQASLKGFIYCVPPQSRRVFEMIRFESHCCVVRF